MPKKPTPGLSPVSRRRAAVQKRHASQIEKGIKDDLIASIDGPRPKKPVKRTQVKRRTPEQIRQDKEFEAFYGKRYGKKQIPDSYPQFKRDYNTDFARGLRAHHKNFPQRTHLHYDRGWWIASGYSHVEHKLLRMKGRTPATAFSQLERKIKWVNAGRPRSLEQKVKSGEVKVSKSSKAREAYLGNTLDVLAGREPSRKDPSFVPPPLQRR